MQRGNAAVSRFRRIIAIAATAGAVLLTTVAAAYALFWLLIGEQQTVVQEGEAVSSVRFVQHPAGIVPLVAAALLLGGLLTRKLLIAWIGFAVLSLFSVLFLFGIGGGLLPVAGLLLICLAIVSAGRTHTTQERPSDTS